MAKPKKGFFIVVEGMDGTGKTTACGILERLIKDTGREVVSIHGTSSTPFGKLLYNALKQPCGAHISHSVQALTFYAARLDIMEQIIVPALEEGKVVICDRWIHTTFSYQRECKFLPALNEMICKGLSPDLTILLDMPISRIKARLYDRARDGSYPLDHLDLNTDKEMEARREGYLKMSYNDKTITTLPAECSIENLESRLLGIVNRYLVYGNIEGA